jgi:hypothetical protein
MVEIQTFLVSHLTLRGSPHEPGLSQPIGPSMTQCAIEALSEIMLERHLHEALLSLDRILQPDQNALFKNTHPAYCPTFTEEVRFFWASDD